EGVGNDGGVAAGGQVGGELAGAVGPEHVVLPAYLVAERDRGTVRGRPAVAGEAHGDAQAGRGLRQGDGASQRRGELGGAVRALERADALEAPLRLGREGEAGDVEGDLEPCPC